jgi:hypothetical protein
MEKISKKDIRATVNETLFNVVSNYQIADPSKKTKKLIEKVSKKFSGELKHELKKHFKKMEKATKKASGESSPSLTKSA